MKFWLGLAIGLVLGAVGTYLAVARPWRGGDGGDHVAIASGGAVDAGVEPKKKGKRKGGVRRSGGANAGGGEAGTDYEVDDEIVLTAADRALEWRGDAVSLPPRTLDMGGGDDSGRPMDDGEIQGGIASGSAPMIDCIKAAVGGAPLSAEVTVQMLVGGDGRVQKLRVRAPAYLHAHGMLACARKAARSFPFPGTGAPTVVTAPFELN